MSIYLEYSQLSAFHLQYSYKVYSYKKIVYAKYLENQATKFNSFKEKQLNSCPPNRCLL